MSSLVYVEFVGKATKLGALITFITNSFLIYLTYFHIQKITGAYKVTILLMAALGILFCVTELIVRPFVHSFYHSFVYFSTDNMFGLSKSVNTMLLIFYSSLYAILISFIAIQFFYRFCLITQSKWIKIFKIHNVPLIIAYLAFHQVIWTLVSIQVLSDSFTDNHFQMELMTEYNCLATEVPGLFVVVYEPGADGIPRIRWSSVNYAGGLSFVLISQYIVIVCCGLEIKWKIDEANSNMSETNHQIQHQLFKTLIFQILTPSVFHHIPVFALFGTVFMDIETRIPFGIMFALFGFFPALDSIILMSLVSEYRETMTNGVTFLLKKLSKFQSSGAVPAGFLTRGPTTAVHSQMVTTF